jgi:hypothetical protein
VCFTPADMQGKSETQAHHPIDLGQAAAASAGREK